MEVLLRTLRKFSENTSISGINNAAKSRSKLRSLLWLAVFTVLAYFTVVDVRDIVVDYFEYPVITHTDISYKSKVDFPAVTVCNLNRVNCGNAFKLKNDIQDQIKQNKTLNQTQKAKMKEIRKKLGSLLSPDVTNCVEPICRSLLSQLLEKEFDEQILNLIQNNCLLEGEQSEQYCKIIQRALQKEVEEPKKKNLEDLMDNMNCTNKCKDTKPNTCNTESKEIGNKKFKVNNGIKSQNKEKVDKLKGKKTKSLEFDGDAKFVKRMFQVPRETR